MTPVLDEIVESVRQRLEQRKRIVSPGELAILASKARKPHDFRSALSTDSGFLPRVIAEVKFASPSQGVILYRSKISPVEVARDYLAAGAVAISVLTEEDHFQGSQSNLIEIRKAFPEARLLMKDFVVDEYQLLEARVSGADAVLLIVAVLGREGMKRFLPKLRALGLTALVEVHDEEEMQIALDLGVDLIGVNNRNLKTMQISLETSFRLSKMANPSVCLVSESGLKERREIDALSAVGYSGFLMGTSLMRGGNPGDSVRSLLERIEPKIKICGLTRFEDAQRALDLGAFALGFIFYSKSLRAITADQAGEIIHKLSPKEPNAPQKLRTVGVFVNATLEEIAQTVKTSGVSMIQLHGDESLEFTRKIRESLPTLKIIRALRPKSESDLIKLESYQSLCEAILIDAYSPDAFGGTGKIGDLNLAIEASRRAPIFLAGGLCPENVAEIINRVRPYGVDVSSGVESEPGKKSPEKLKAFFSQVKAGSNR